MCVRCEKSGMADECQYPLPSWLDKAQTYESISAQAVASKPERHISSGDLSSEIYWYTSNLQAQERIVCEIGTFAHDPYLCTLNLDSAFSFDTPFCESVIKEVQKTSQKQTSANDTFESLLFIEMMFPRRATFWDLIDTFFRFVYPFVPFLDKHMFCDDVTRLTGPRLSEQSKVTLKVKKKLDFARVGILLIVLRLAYLVIPSGDNYVSEDAIKAARYCFKSFRVLKKSNLAILQMTLFLHIYENVAPETEMFLCSTETHLFTGVLLQMALAMGINRDPSKYSPGIGRDYKTCNLCRKIWFYIYSLDTQQSAVGLPPQANSHLFDTTLPVSDESADLIEKVVRSNTEAQYHADLEHRRILKYVFSLSDIPEMAVVAKHMFDLENTLEMPFSDIGSIPRVYEVKRFYEKCSFLCWLHYKCFLHHVARRNPLSYYHQEKAISLAVQLTRCGFAVVELGREFQFFLVPTLERSVNMILLFQYSLLLWQQQDVEGHAEKLTRNVERGLKLMAHYSGTYYYAWRSYRVQTYIYSLAQKTISQRHLPHFSNDQKLQPDDILQNLPSDSAMLPEASQADGIWLAKYAARLTSELGYIGESSVTDICAVLKDTFFDDIL